jgi:hypothetical protein
MEFLYLGFFTFLTSHVFVHDKVEGRIFLVGEMVVVDEEIECTVGD